MGLSTLFSRYLRFLALILTLGLVTLFPCTLLPGQDNTDDPKAQIQALIKEAQDSFRMADYENAARKYQQSLKISKDIGDPELTVQVLGGLANSRLRQNNYRASILLYQEALDLARSSGLEGKEFELLSGLGKAYGYSGEKESALRIQLEAYGLARKMEDKEKMESILNDIGTICYACGDFQDALEYYQRAVKISLSLEGKGHEGFIFINIGEVYRRTRDYTQAADYYTRAYEYAQRAGNKNLEWAARRSLAFVAYEQGNCEEALRHYEPALAYYEETGNKSSIAATSNAIGKVHLKTGDLKKARDCFQKSYDIFTQTGQILIMHPLNYLGDVYLQEGKLESALKFYQKSLEIAASSHTFNYLIELHHKIGIVYEKSGDYALSLDHYLKSIAEIESVRTHIGGEKLKAGFMSGYLEVYARAVRVLLLLHRDDPSRGLDRRAFHLAEQARARALLDSLQESRIDLSTEMESKDRHREGELSRNISKILSELQNPSLEKTHRDEFLRDLARAEGEYEQFITQIRRKNSRYAALVFPKPSGAEEVQTNLLDSKTALIAYTLSDSYAQAFLLTKHSLHIYELEPGRSLDERAASYLLTLSLKGDDFQEPSRALYQALIEPLLPGLSQDIERLIIIPDRNFNYLPFESLIAGERAGEPVYLIEKFRISYSPSASLLLSLDVQRPEKPDKDLLGFGDPVYTREGTEEKTEETESGDILRSSFLDRGYELPRLASSSAELKSISQNFKRSSRRLFLREKASEEAVKSQKLDRYKILHFATHGLIDEQFATRSSIVLTLDQDPAEDGFLQAREIYKLRLNAELVVLSACQTARGKLERGEGVSGLYRAFFYAGTKSVLASLWKIEDRLTADFMKAFYDEVTVGIGKDEALRRAKLRMISAGRSHPSDWSAFILIGDYVSRIKFQKPSFWEKILPFI